MDCIFCKIISNELPSYKIYEDDYTIAILDINPINPGHVLVLPKVHYGKLSEIDEMEAIPIFRTLKRIEKVVAESGCTGTNILQNNGRDAGQEIGHVHFHIIPRFKNDSFRMKYHKVNLTNEMLEYSKKYYISKLK